MASALFLCLGVTLWKATCTEIATSPLTSPVQRHELMRQLELTLGLEAPKNWLWLQVPISGIAPSCRWDHFQYFSPDLDPDPEKKVQKFLGDQVPGSGPRPQLHIQHRQISKPGSVHTAACGHGHPRRSSRQAAGYLALTCLQLSLVSPLSTFGIVWNPFLSSKKYRTRLGRNRGAKPARERLSRGIKFACPSF